MTTVHVYRGWKVSETGAKPVHFSDQSIALSFFTRCTGRSELVMTLTEVICGKERGRAFCSHCKSATFTTTR